jgi:hypothetical protein
VHNQNIKKKDLNSLKITNNIKFQNAGVIGHPSSGIGQNKNPQKGQKKTKGNE